MKFVELWWEVVFEPHPLLQVLVQQLVLVPLAEAAAQHILYSYGRCSEHRVVRQVTTPPTGGTGPPTGAPGGSGMVSSV